MGSTTRRSPRCLTRTTRTTTRTAWPAPTCARGQARGPGDPVRLHRHLAGGLPRQPLHALRGPAAAAQPGGDGSDDEGGSRGCCCLDPPGPSWNHLDLLVTSWNHSYEGPVLARARLATAVPGQC